MQVEVKVEVECRIPLTADLPMRSATQLTTLWPVLSDEQREVLRETQLRFQREAAVAGLR